MTDPTPAPRRRSRPSRTPGAALDHVRRVRLFLAEAVRFRDVLLAESGLDVAAVYTELGALEDALHAPTTEMFSLEGELARAEGERREVAGSALRWAQDARLWLRLATLTGPPAATPAARTLTGHLRPLNRPRPLVAVRALHAFLTSAHLVAELGDTATAARLTDRAADLLGKLQAATVTVQRLEQQAAELRIRQAAAVTPLDGALERVRLHWDLTRGRVVPPLPKLPIRQRASTRARAAADDGDEGA